MLPKIPLLCLVAGLACAPWLTAATISSADARVRYVGRFDHQDAAGPRCTWSASSVTVRLDRGSLNVTLNDSGKNFWQIVVNGEPTGVLELKKGEHTYPVVEALPEGAHTIELVKRTEFIAGVTQIVGFEIDDGAELLAPVNKVRRIEVIGDSISCGYGNEAPNQNEKFSGATENAWLAYGAVAARAVNADYVCVAWSGKKLWPNNSILDHYDRVLPGDRAPRWDFSAWTPDVVVINLGTNDFNAKANPEEAGWVAAYVEFINRIRASHPDAAVYCAVGPMLSNSPASRQPRTTILGYLEKVLEQTNAAGGSPVRLIDFGVQKSKNGYGADWHPSAKTHAVMGEQLAARLKTDLGW